MLSGLHPDIVAAVSRRSHGAQAPPRAQILVTLTQGGQIITDCVCPDRTVMNGMMGTAIQDMAARAMMQERAAGNVLVDTDALKAVNRSRT